MAVKILGICGSYRKASTYAALQAAMEAAAAQGDVETRIIELRGRDVHACIGCDRCKKEAINACLTFHDGMDEVFDAFMEADAYIIASPVYSMGITPVLSAVFSRFRPNINLSLKNPDMNLFKVGGAIAVGGTRNGGQESAISCIQGFYHTKGITVVNGGLGAYSGGSVWSRDGGAEGARADEEGIRHAQAVGRRVAKAALALQRGTAQA